MKDLTSPGWIKAKGVLFLFLGSLSAALLLLQHPTWQTASWLAISVWSFCRFYYFAFYVIEHYVDPNFHFSGLVSFVKYMARLPRTPKA